MNIKFIKLSEYGIKPTKAYENDAGFDLYSACDIIMKPNEQTLIPSDIAMEIPIGYCGIIKNRSSIAKCGILTYEGVIDSDYRGNVKIMLKNISPINYNIKRGDRIAQMLIHSVPIIEFVESNELTETIRDNKGFGHSGK